MRHSGASTRRGASALSACILTSAHWLRNSPSTLKWTSLSPSCRRDSAVGFDRCASAYSTSARMNQLRVGAPRAFPPSLPARHSMQRLSLGHPDPRVLRGRSGCITAAPVSHGERSTCANCYVASGWVGASLLGRGCRVVEDGFRRILVRLPFPLAVCPDNGRFFNHHMARFWAAYPRSRLAQPSLPTRTTTVSSERRTARWCATTSATSS